MTKYIPDLNFFFSSIGLGINFFFTSVILVLAAFFGFYEFAAELGLLKAGIFMVCQMLSSNARSIIIAKNKISSTEQFLSFRLIFGFIIFSVSSIIIFLLDSNFKFLIFNLSTIIIVQWIAEIIITSYHSKKKDLEKIIFIFFQMTFLFSSFLCFWYGSLFLLELISIAYILFYLIFFLKYFSSFFNTLEKFSIQNNIKNLFKLSLLSSASINFTNLTWRVMIINIISKDYAGALFGGFAVASFIGSFFYNIVGPILFQNKDVKKTLKFLIDYLLLIIVLAGCFLVYYFQDYFSGYPEIKNYFYNTILISLIGSYFMMKSHFLRFEFFFSNEKNHNSVFNFDIIYSFFCILTVPVLFFIGNLEGLKYSYLAASIFSFLIFLTLSQSKNMKR